MLHNTQIIGSLKFLWLIIFIYTKPLFKLFLPDLCELLSRHPVIGFMRFWTCWKALDLDYNHEKRVIDLGHWSARYCILKIEYIIVSYIIILRYGSIGGALKIIHYFRVKC